MDSRDQIRAAVSARATIGPAWLPADPAVSPERDMYGELATEALLLAAATLNDGEAAVIRQVDGTVRVVRRGLPDAAAAWTLIGAREIGSVLVCVAERQRPTVRVELAPGETAAETTQIHP